MKFFVFSDVHGFYNELIEELKKNGFDVNNPEHKLISCGDNFDRGPQNVEMLDFLKEMVEKDKIILVRGNHEDLLIDCLLRGEYYSHDIHNGTYDTIIQLGRKIYKSDILPPFSLVCEKVIKETKIIDFIVKNSVDYFETSNYIFTHGYLPTENDLLKKNWRDASRKEWKDARWLNGMDEVVKKNNGVSDKTVVVGHFHCSYGNVRQKYGWDIDSRTAYFKEFYETDENTFKPFKSEGIIAIDACTAFTKQVNVIVIENDIQKENVLKK